MKSVLKWQQWRMNTKWQLVNLTLIFNCFVKCLTSLYNVMKYYLLNIILGRAKSRSLDRYSSNSSDVRSFNSCNNNGNSKHRRFRRSVDTKWQRRKTWFFQVSIANFAENKTKRFSSLLLLQSRRWSNDKAHFLDSVNREFLCMVGILFH